MPILQFWNGFQILPESYRDTEFRNTDPGSGDDPNRILNPSVFRYLGPKPDPVLVPIRFTGPNFQTGNLY